MTQKIPEQELKFLTEACVKDDIEISQHFSETDTNAG